MMRLLLANLFRLLIFVLPVTVAAFYVMSYMTRGGATGLGAAGVISAWLWTVFFTAPFVLAAGVIHILVSWVALSRLPFPRRVVVFLVALFAYGLLFLVKHPEGVLAADGLVALLSISLLSALIFRFPSAESSRPLSDRK